MKLYGALLSPFVRKVALIAAEKDLPCELVVSNPGGPNPEFVEASPFGKIPAIRDGDFTLADSSAIAHYLEAKQPSPALIPAEAQARGRAIWFDEFADTIFAGAGLKIVFNRLVAPKLLKLPYDEEVAKQGEAELLPILAYLESAALLERQREIQEHLVGAIHLGRLMNEQYIRQAPDSAQAAHHGEQLPIMFRLGEKG